MGNTFCQLFLIFLLTNTAFPKEPEPFCKRYPEEWEKAFRFTKRTASCPPFPKEDDPFHLFPSRFPSLFPPSIKFIRSTPSSKAREERRDKFSHLKFVYFDVPTLEQVIPASGLSFCNYNETEDWLGFFAAGPTKRFEIYSPYNINKKEGRKSYVMPGSEVLDYKIPFTKKYRKYQEKFGWDFHLPSFILPDEKAQFLTAFQNNSNKFIYKPSTGWKSRGVFVLRNLKFLKLKKRRKEEAVVQTYLEDVFLFKGAKVEPRFHVLMTSVNPLRIYLWDEGFVKLFKNYEKTISEYGEKENISIKNVRGYVRRSLLKTFARMRKEGFNSDTFMEQAKDIIIKTIIMGESDLTRVAKDFPRGTSFQYWSVDFMWDRNMKPYLVEINRYLALDRGDRQYFQGVLLADIFNLVGFPYQKGWEKNDFRQQFQGNNCSLELKEVLGIENITKQDLLTLMESEDEMYRMRWTRFNRIFPRTDTFRYLEFLEGDLSPYILQQRWEQAFHSRREVGISLLRCAVADYF